MSQRLQTKLQDKITAYEQSRPRSQQKTMGPSELADPCARKLAFKLSNKSGINPGGAKRAATVGTALHSLMEAVLADDPEWVLEKRLDIGGRTQGKSDALWIPEKTVVDFKFSGDTTVGNVRRNGPGDQYRGQIHLYGKGWQQAGFAVEHVAIAFLSKQSESKDLVWAEEYDEGLANQVLDRLDAIRDDLAGGKTPLQITPTPSRMCLYCPYFGSVEDEEKGLACAGTLRRRSGILFE